MTRFYRRWPDNLRCHIRFPNRPRTPQPLPHQIGSDIYWAYNLLNPLLNLLLNHVTRYTRSRPLARLVK